MKAILLMVVLMALLMEILGASLNRPSEDEAEGTVETAAAASGGEDKESAISWWLHTDCSVNNAS